MVQVVKILLITTVIIILRLAYKYSSRGKNEIFVIFVIFQRVLFVLYIILIAVDIADAGITQPVVKLRIRSQRWIATFAVLHVWAKITAQ